MAGISSKAASSLINKKGYNGNELQNKEFSDGGGLEFYDFNARTYDQQIGRFIQVDPESEEADQESWSPYHFSYNNPVTFSDPDGRLPIIPIIWGLYELSSAAYDAYQAYKTVSDKKASTGEKAAAVGGVLLSAVLPGGGYGTAAKQGLKTLDKASDAAKAVDKANDASKASKATQLSKNKAAGKAGEKQVKDDLKNELNDGEALLEQPSFKTAKGNRAKPDYAIIDKEGNVVKTIDSKTGKAKLSPNQKDLQQNGGTLVGKKYKEHNGAVAKPNTLEERRPF